MSRLEYRVYRISPLRWSLVVAPGVLFIGLFGVLGIVARSGGLLAAAALVLVIYTPVIFIVWRTRLILSSEGVDLRQLGYRLSTPWSNIAAVDRTPGREGFVLSQPLESRGAHRLGGMADVQITSSGVTMAGYQGGRSDLVAQRRFIPIEAFGYWFKRGDLESVIRRFVPDVNMESHELAVPSMPLRRKILVIAIIVVSGSLGLLIGSGVLPTSVNDFFIRILNSVTALCCLIVGLAGLSSTVHFAIKKRPALAILALAAALISLAAAVYEAV